MPAKLPWTIELWGARRHPSQLYEIGAALLRWRARTKALSDAVEPA